MTTQQTTSRTILHVYQYDCASRIEYTSFHFLVYSPSLFSAFHYSPLFFSIPFLFLEHFSYSFFLFLFICLLVALSEYYISIYIFILFFFQHKIFL